MNLFKPSQYFVDFDQNEDKPSLTELNDILNILIQRGEILRYGDIVCNIKLIGYKCNGLMIFDGNNLISTMKSRKEYGMINEKFKVFERNPSTGIVIPSNYWHHINEINQSNRVWFDHTRYRSELIENARYDTIDHPDKFVVYSFFHIDFVKKFVIVDEPNTSNINHTLKIFKKVLAYHTPLYFEVPKEDKIYGFSTTYSNIHRCADFKWCNLIASCIGDEKSIENRLSCIILDYIHMYNELENCVYIVLDM